ncbi:MAG TPA: ATP-binding protein [Thermosulfurimonas dismutans]|uniref:ATP-binding protein n=1 Tax=Thermosulfurimonas dismutans TaxID=999894 RepID=A0A7C3CW73_9BACT|nr:ATP-binding protein [Thermosulfurimonas dismutans]
MKEILKTIIREFHLEELPSFVPRDLRLPLSSGKIITLIGPRRAGKTYLFYQHLSELLRKGVPKERILYLNFEDERLDFTPQTLDLILQAYRELYPEIELREVYFFFDEIQNAPEWERFVRRIYDRYSRNIFLTGSNSKLLSQEIATSLRGRTLKYEIYPLSFREFLRFKEFDFDPRRDFYHPQKRARLLSFFEEYLLFGGFPEIVFLPRELKFKTLQEYFEVMLYRDLAERYQIRDTLVLKYFLKRLIENTAKPLSVHKIYNELRSQGLKVGKDTLYRYLEYAETVFLVKLLRKHYRSVVKTELGERKIYPVDQGWIKALRYLGAEERGVLLETVVFKELFVLGEEIFYYSGRGECDFILNGKTALQVCYDFSKEETLKREVRGLKKACEYFGFREGFILTFDQEDTLTINSLKIRILPVYKFLLEGIS